MSQKSRLIIIVILVVIAVILVFLRGHPIDAESIPVKEKIETPIVFKGRPIHYHEVLVGYRSWFNYSVVIYNDLNNVLTDEEFFALDKKQIKKDTQADIVIMNGPRYWVLDEIYATHLAPRRHLGGYEWSIPGAVDISLLDAVNRKPYTSMQVNRDTKYTYYKDKKVYQIKTDQGTVYTMQAFSQIIDKDQNLESLDTLAQRLKLPTGWSYEVTTLNENMILESGGTTEILQDDFQNTYQRSVR